MVEALYEPWFYLPVALLGFEPLAVMLALQVNITYMFGPIHSTSSACPVVLAMFVTPRTIAFTTPVTCLTSIKTTVARSSSGTSSSAPLGRARSSVWGAYSDSLGQPLTVTTTSWRAWTSCRREWSSRAPGFNSFAPGLGAKWRGLTTRRAGRRGAEGRGAPRLGGLRKRRSRKALKGGKGRHGVTSQLGEALAGYAEGDHGGKGVAVRNLKKFRHGVLLWGQEGGKRAPQPFGLGGQQNIPSNG